MFKRSRPRSTISFVTGNGKVSTSSGKLFCCAPGDGWGAGVAVAPAALGFLPVKNSVSVRSWPRSIVPSIGCRVESPSVKKVELRNGFILGWSCMSRRQPAEIRISHKEAQKTQTNSLDLLCLMCLFVAVISDFDIINFQSIQTLQQLNHFRVIELRIVGFDRQEESIACCQCKIRGVENRVKWLRQLIQHQHSQHRRERRAQHRHFKRNRNERGPTVERLAADVERVVDYFHPVLHKKPG